MYEIYHISVATSSYLLEMPLKVEAYHIIEFDDTKPVYIYIYNDTSILQTCIWYIFRLILNYFCGWSSIIIKCVLYIPIYYNTLNYYC